MKNFCVQAPHKKHHIVFMKGYLEHRCKWCQRVIEKESFAPKQPITKPSNPIKVIAVRLSQELLDDIQSMFQKQWFNSLSELVREASSAYTQKILTQTDNLQGFYVISLEEQFVWSHERSLGGIQKSIKIPILLLQTYDAVVSFVEQHNTGFNRTDFIRIALRIFLEQHKQLEQFASDVEKNLQSTFLTSSHIPE